MAKIRVIFEGDVTTTRRHMFGNLAEDIWRELREERRTSVDLDAVDHGSSVLTIETRKALVGRTLVVVHRLIERNWMTADVRIGTD